MGYSILKRSVGPGFVRSMLCWALVGGAAIAARGQEPRPGDTASKDTASKDGPAVQLLEFYADWCGPCNRLAPLLEEIASDNPNAKIVKVNVDENPQLAARYHIDSIPNLKVFKGGKVVAEQVGFADQRRLEFLLLSTRPSSCP